MTIIWPCRLSVEEYAAAGKAVEVPRPTCPGCGSSMMFWSGYPRAVRLGAVFEIWVKRGYCRGCCSSDALLPSFCLVRRLDAVEVIGPALEAVCSERGTRPVARSLGELFAYTTVRGWWRCHRERAWWVLRVLGAVLGWALPGGSGVAEADALEALASLGATVSAGAGVGLWPAVSLALGGTWLTANSDAPTTGAVARSLMRWMAHRTAARPP